MPKVELGVEEEEEMPYGGLMCRVLDGKEVFCLDGCGIQFSRVTIIPLPQPVTPGSKSGASGCLAEGA